MMHEESYYLAFEKILSEIEGDKNLFNANVDLLLTFAMNGNYQGRHEMARLITEEAWSWKAYDQEFGITRYPIKCSWFLRRLGSYAFFIANIDRMKQAVRAGANIKAKFLSGNPKNTPKKCIDLNGNILEIDNLNTDMLPCEKLSCSCWIGPTASGFEGAEFTSKTSHASGRAWTNEELRAQAEEFAKREGLSPGGGLPKPSIFTILRARLKYWLINKI